MTGTEAAGKRMEKTTSTSTTFTQPIRQILLMLIVIGLLGAGVWLAYPALVPVFRATPELNAFIGFVFFIGVLSCFWQVVQLFQSVGWIESFVRSRPGLDYSAAPRLLAPLAALLGTRSARTTIPSSSAVSILDSVATRIDEARDITRYLGNLLIFLGLLGTFYGLATTIPAMVDTIRGLAPQEGESGVDVFGKLMSGLEAQLGGMGTAFSSSLLGLAGSLVVGLLELFASHGQNRFYRQLEEWLSSITRLGFGSSEADGGDAGHMIAVIDGLAGQMDALQSLHAESELSRTLLEERLAKLADGIERLAGGLASYDPEKQDATMARHEALLTRIADGQEQLASVLGAPESAASADAESRMRLRSIDVQLLRILEEISAGRQESMSDLRADLSSLTGAIRQLSRAPGGRS
jgi:hypothetical protein